MRGLAVLLVFFFSGCLEDSRLSRQDVIYSPSNPFRKSPWVVSPDEPPLKKGSKTFGLYFWHKDPECDFECGLLKEAEIIGRIPEYLLYYTDMERPFPAYVFETAEKYRIQVVLSQDLNIYQADEKTCLLKEIIEGKWDSYFKALALRMHEDGQRSYYRFGYEMNGDWFSWGQRPDNFKRAWRHVWFIFQKASAVNVKWVFSPSILYGSLSPDSGLHNYYPGDEYVDVVGIDGYNFGSTKQYQQWTWASDVFQATIDEMRKQYPHKPLWITEAGSAPDEDEYHRRKVHWLRDFLRYLDENNDIENFIWFNEDKTYGGETNWRLDSDPETLEMFRNWAETDPDPAIIQ